MSTSTLELIKDKAERQVKSIRATKHWAMSDPRIKYTLGLLDSLVERHGGHLTPYLDSNYILVTYRLHKLGNFLDEKLLSLLNSMEHASYDKLESSELAVCRERSYTFKWHGKDQDSEKTFLVSIDASLDEESDTCKRILVGYREAGPPSPIYKLVCEGDEGFTTVEGMKAA